MTEVASRGLSGCTRSSSITPTEPRKKTMKSSRRKKRRAHTAWSSAATTSRAEKSYTVEPRDHPLREDDDDVIEVDATEKRRLGTPGATEMDASHKRPTS